MPDTATATETTETPVKTETSDENIDVKDNTDGDKADNLDTGKSTKIDIEEILDEYGLDSPGELKEFVASLNEMKGKIGDEDLDSLIENSKQLKEYQQAWQQQEEEKRRENETPEQTIARLEKEKKEIHNKSISQAQRVKAAKAAEQALNDFTDTVTGVIKNAKDLPPEYRPFVAKFMGIENPINEVDITDRAAVRRLTKDVGLKEVAAFEQQVIKRYLAGKIKIPDVTPADTAGKPGKPNPKNLKEAKSLMLASVKGLLNK